MKIIGYNSHDWVMFLNKVEDKIWSPISFFFFFELIGWEIILSGYDLIRQSFRAQRCLLLALKKQIVIL
jgi:hypothetical protein